MLIRAGARRPADEHEAAREVSAESAIGTYLDARDSQLLEFSICPAHHDRLQRGSRPVILAERFGLCDVDGHPALVLD